MDPKLSGMHAGKVSRLVMLLHLPGSVRSHA
jgi:hypothetical protein